MAALTNDDLENLRHLINNLNLGAQKAALGEIFIGMLQRIEELENGGGGGEPVAPNWDDLEGKPAVIAAGANQAAARNAIGAGTSSFSGNYADLSGAPTIPAAPTWSTLSGKPAVIAAGADQAAARQSIGAAAPGDIPAAPTWSTLDGKPAVIAGGADQAAARQAIGAGTSSLVLGTGPAQAASGDHDHAVTADTASGLEAAANLQELAVALSARIKLLEDAG